MIPLYDAITTAWAGNDTLTSIPLYLELAGENTAYPYAVFTDSPTSTRLMYDSDDFSAHRVKFIVYHTDAAAFASIMAAIKTLFNRASITVVGAKRCTVKPFLAGTVRSDGYNKNNRMVYRAPSTFEFLVEGEP